MATDTLTHAFTEDAVRALSRELAEPEWALEQRLVAFRLFQSMEWPRESEEFWKRTDVVPFDLARFHLGHAAQPAEIRLETEPPPGALILDLDRAVREHPDLVKPHLGSLVPASRNRFAALHYAFRRGGVFAHIPRGIAVRDPQSVVTELKGDGLSAFPHTLIVAEEAAGINLIDEKLGTGGEQLIVDVAEVVLSAGSHVNHNVVQEWSTAAVVHSFQRFTAARDSTMESVNVLVGGSVTVNHVDATLQGEGATGRMAGILFATGEQRVDQQTLQEHAAPHTTSDLLYKSVLTGNATSNYSGLIRVHPGAQKTDAYQANRNLLLSRAAHADSVPKLEIEANDVRCTHGATVGPVDQDQIFYLMARGLRRDEAERLVVEGFLQPVIDRIPLESVRERIRFHLDRRIVRENVPA